MDVDHLSLLRELADRGSVTEVAYATGRTPSAVSQQLKALQREAGVVLVERVGRGVQLTDAGHALVRASMGIATAVAAAEAAWQEYLGEVGGTVRISLFYSAAELLLPGLLDRLADHPTITVETVDQDVSQDDFAALTVDHDIVVAHRSDDRRPRARGLRWCRYYANHWMWRCRWTIRWHTGPACRPPTSSPRTGSPRRRTSRSIGC